MLYSRRLEGRRGRRRSSRGARCGCCNMRAGEGEESATSEMSREGTYERQRREHEGKERERG